MPLTQQQFARIRAVANTIVSRVNREGKYRSLVQVRPGGRGALVTVSLQPGGPRPTDELSYLGTLLDTIVMELRLEQDALRRPLYRTEEATFSTGDNTEFQFQLWLADEEEEF